MRQQLTGGLMLIFSVRVVYYIQLSSDLLFIHHCFCSERCYFCTFGVRLVACRANTGGSCRELLSNTMARNYYKHYSQCSSHGGVNILRAYFQIRNVRRKQKMLNLLLLLLPLVYY